MYKNGILDTQNAVCCDPEGFVLKVEKEKITKNKSAWEELSVLSQGEH